jgi:predicted dehydrogenase
MSDIVFLTCEPGHFHAALVQKEMYAGVSPDCHIYAEPGPDLDAHLARLAAFNGRPDKPTAWQAHVHAGPAPLDRLLAERRGNVVVLSGRNRGKVQAIEQAVKAGLHVLADKPWVIDAGDLPVLRSVLDTAEKRGVVAYDIMTERYEITSLLQRELVNDEQVFGEMEKGSADEPGVSMDSVHYLLKRVSGAVNRRPAWFFDTEQLGEGLTDVGTHLVDLAAWTLFPEQALADADVQMLTATRWPTVLGREDFQRVTGENDYPDSLTVGPDGRLAYFCNNAVTFALRGVAVRLDIRWDYEAPPGGGDTHLAVYRGTRSSVEVRQGQGAPTAAQLLVVPRRADDRAGVRAALLDKVERLQGRFPGVALAEAEGQLRVTVPEAYHVGHEAHFGQVMRQFLRYVAGEEMLPAWERPNMLAKYRVTTEGVRLARQA